MGNRGKSPTWSNVDGVVIATTKFALKLGGHGITGSHINGTVGIPTYTGGGAAGPSIFTIDLNRDGTGDSTYSQLLHWEATITPGSGSTVGDAFRFRPISGSAQDGRFVVQLVSGALPNAGNTNPGTPVAYSGTLDKEASLTGSIFAIFRKTSRAY